MWVPTPPSTPTCGVTGRPCDLAGACAGGSALVLQWKGGDRVPRELAGKRLATRNWEIPGYSSPLLLKQHGLKTRKKGGGISLPGGQQQYYPAFPPRGDRRAWTVEPWVSRLVVQEGGYIFLAEEELWPDGLSPPPTWCGATAFSKTTRNWRPNGSRRTSG